MNQIEDHIERGWAIKGHQDVPDIRDKAFKPPRLLQLKTHFLETGIFYVYAIMAIVINRLSYNVTNGIFLRTSALARASLLPLDIVCIR